MASKDQIESWLESAKPNHTHMFVVCDTFDYDDFPVFVSCATEKDVKLRQDQENKISMQKVMEVYNLKMPVADQLNQYRAFNY